MKVAIKLSWDAVPGADSYTVHGHVAGDALIGPVETWETEVAQVAIQVPVGVLYTVNVFSQAGRLLSIESTQANLYVSKW